MGAQRQRCQQDYPMVTLIFQQIQIGYSNITKIGYHTQQVLGEQGVQGIQGEQGESGVGVGNTGEPFLLTAQSGGSSTYVDVKNTIYLSWSGSQGTYHLTLPSATSNPYRVIRVINDGTLGAQDKVHIVSPSPQTIDGVAEYVLNKSYSGIQAWSDGSNWIVIQAKSHQLK